MDDLIESLDQRAEIPNLNGIKISWYGLGQVSDPQPLLSRLGIQNLQYVWGTLLKKAGNSQDGMQIDGESAVFMSTTTSGGIESDQYVTSIEWNFIEEPETSDNKNVNLNLPESKITFCSNTDEYLLPEQAEEIINLYKLPLEDYSDKMLLLIGTTSSWRGGSLKLSEERAEKVKQSMINLGIPEECIDVIGVGYDLNICQDDSPYGQFEESIAQGNRSVLILPYDSFQAQEILSTIE